MLKITYLENDIRLEYLSKSLEEWKSERILLNLRAAVGVFTTSSTANLVFPRHLPRLRELFNLAEREELEVAPCDQEYIEIALSGSWMAQTEQSELGIFICEITPESEQLLAQLWQDSQMATPVN